VWRAVGWAALPVLIRSVTEQGIEGPVTEWLPINAPLTADFSNQPSSH